MFLRHHAYCSRPTLLPLATSDTVPLAV